MKTSWKWPHTLITLVIAPVATFVAGWVLPPIGGWVAAALALTALVVVAGHGLAGLARGAFVDEQHYVSLSRLQTVMWTIVVSSAFVIAAIANLHTGQANPLDVALPGELWILLGISGTSLVGTPLIRSQKAKRAGNTENFAATLKELGFAVSKNDVKKEGKGGRDLRVDDAAEAKIKAGDADPGADPTLPPRSNGVVVIRARPEDSSWSDLFRGEDTGNAALLDLGKVQMLYFTLTIVGAYVVAIGRLFIDSNGAAITELPALSDGAVGLLGISHASYLANKAVDRP